ncbi:MAG: MBL fold metallo-hydrolase [Parvularcula sp.]|jgi:glyoxylase-like metal-dependent hydrolase (beta-lactamase superfamily II)|nr:MBL fold metallo-hydrolase [Parvularcula sp.]
MIFEQFFDPEAHALSYLLAGGPGEDAVLIDPVDRDIAKYRNVLAKLCSPLKLVIDTHLHADHVTGAGELARATGCLVAMSEKTEARHVTLRVVDGQRLTAGTLQMRVAHTPGHTKDSICIVMDDRVFTGDTLLIGGTGRTDLPGGDAHSQFFAIRDRLMTLPGDTLVYPGHDYRGARVSTIDHERETNPRFRYEDADAYASCMASLDLGPPRAMHGAIPANLNGGLAHAS